MNYIQQWVDRFFNRERYDYRRTLLEFARDLTSELHVDSLLQQISDRLSETLGVDRLAVFLAAEPNGFRLVRSRGMNFTGKTDTSFLDPAQPALAKGYLFFDSVKRRSMAFLPPRRNPSSNSSCTITCLLRSRSARSVTWDWARRARAIISPAKISTSCKRLPVMSRSPWRTPACMNRWKCGRAITRPARFQPEHH